MQTRPKTEGGARRVPRRARQRGRYGWQRTLLPFMVLMVSGLSIFFFWISLTQLEALQQRIEQAPRVDLAPALDVQDETVLAGGNRLLYVQWKTLALLEAHALERRYHQANVLLMSRTWIRYLGFITGMILALVGAAFILGKLRERESDLSLSNQAASVAFKSTSPGLVLAVLGTILMLTTILTNERIDVGDAPLYTRFMLAPTAAGGALPAPPAPWPDPFETSRSDSAIIRELEE